MANKKIISESYIEYFSLFCDQWLAENAHSWKAASTVKYSTILNKHIKPALGSCPVQEITSGQVRSFSEKLMLHLSAKSVRDILTVLHQVLNYAARYIPLDPVEISYPRLAARELRVLDRKEQLRLTGYLNQNLDLYKFATLLSLSTGLRIGEVCALRGTDFSIETGTVTVRHTVQRLKTPSTASPQKTSLCLGTPKTSHSLRTIPLSGDLLNFYDQLMDFSPEFFLLTKASRPADPRTLQRRFQKYAAACDIKNVHFHTLRHTFATRCVEVGCDIKTLSEILGHSNITMTMSRYVHPSLEFKRQNLMKLDAAGFGCSIR